MPYADVVAEVGAERAAQLRELTVRILARGNEIAGPRGILIADTKVEFGVRPDGTLVLADEVLTPDSSRFWRAADWAPGRRQASYDKQFVRDWLTSPASGWDRTSGEQPPALPDDVVEQTRAKYVEAYEALTGRTFS
jgi:phosphoribosylaminoimidazole-succinocarboxamide synthase